MMHFLVYYFQQHSVRLLTYSLQRWRSLLLGRQPKRGLLHQLIFRFAKLDCPTRVCQVRYNISSAFLISSSVGNICGKVFSILSAEYFDPA